ncbi:hypothetical protein FACS1894125_2070 [Actinomycetota bacterium]|nr:hypothetical protein FACS1894125_2070 [Actinomycetota bacterium]
MIFFLIAVVLLIRSLPLPQKTTPKSTQVLCDNLVFRIVLSISLIFAYYEVLALLLYWTGLTVNAPVINLVLLVICAAIYHKNRPSKHTLTRRTFSIKETALDLLPATFVSVITFAGTYFIDGHFELSSYSIMQSISLASDDVGNHLYIFGKFFMSSNSGYFNDSYTAGQEWATSLLSTTSLPWFTEPTGMTLVYFYVLFKLLSYVFVILSITLFIKFTYKHVVLRDKSAQIVDNVVIYGLSIILSYFIFEPLYVFGFYSYIPVLGYLLIAATLLVSLMYNNSGGVQSKGNYLIFVYGFIITCAISTTWFIAMPCAFLALVICAIKFLNFRELSAAKRTKLLISASTPIITMMLVFLLFETNPESSGATNSLELDGAFPNMPTYLVQFVVLLTVAALAVNYFFVTPRKFTALSIFTTVTLVFWAAVSIYFTVVVKNSTYYYYKIETLSLTVFIPVVCIFLLQLLSLVKVDFLKLAVFPLIVVVYFSLFPLSTSTALEAQYNNYLTPLNRGWGALDHSIAQTIYTNFNQSITSGDFNKCQVFIDDVYTRGVTQTNFANVLMNNDSDNSISPAESLRGVCPPPQYDKLADKNKLSYKMFHDRAVELGIPYKIYLPQNTRTMLDYDIEPDDIVEVVVN